MLVAEPDECRKIRGEILAEATDIEKYLTEFISDYFAKDNEKREELYNLIFNTELFSFRKKIELFKKIIPKFSWEVNGENRQEELVSAFIFISEVRNKVAHWNWSLTGIKEEDYCIQNPRKNEEVLKLDKELLDEYNKGIRETLQFFDAWEDRG
jgi:hypothetical protein